MHEQNVAVTPRQLDVTLTNQHLSLHLLSNHRQSPSSFSKLLPSMSDSETTYYGDAIRSI